MGKPTTKDWDEIQSDYEQMETMSCVPSLLKKVPTNYIFDEDQSVKWNRQKVEENNVAYMKEVARLNTLKNKKRDEILEDIYRTIQFEVGHNLSRKKAICLWCYAWEEGHSWGIATVRNHLERIIEIADILLTKEV